MVSKRRVARNKGGRPPLPLEVREKFWAGIGAGMEIRDAAVAAGASPDSGHRWLRQCGGVKPRPRKPRAGHLTITDRTRIQQLLQEGIKPAGIARAMGRPTSTITRELERGRDTHGDYLPWLGQNRVEAAMRRPKERKLDRNERLREEVAARLAKKHSPEQISGRLRADFPDDPEMWVSPEAIYQALYVQPRGKLNAQVKESLRTGRIRRKPHGRTSVGRKGPVSGMVMISERPAEAADRAVPGHWEGDLLMGEKNLSAIGTLVERSTGFLMLLHLPQDHTSATVAAAMTAAIPRIPQVLRRSLTWDQGSEMALHTQITAATGLPIYFCDPHSPWQRGTNENTNGLLRQYFPKGTDLSFHGPGILDNVAAELNARPRQRHGWATPAELLDQLLSQQQDQDNDETVAPTA